MRKIERHPSSQGSVVTFDMYGQEVNLFVADAKYRAFKAWGTYETDIPYVNNVETNVNYIEYYSSNNPDKLLSHTMSDTQLQVRFPLFKNDPTAKQHTEHLMQYADAEATHWCRRQKISGIGQLDLPNIYELMVLYLESDRIDALDPTVNEYKQYALGKLNTYGRFTTINTTFFWSSTEYSNLYYGSIVNNGYVYHNNKNCVRCVIPVKELNIE